MFKPLLTQVEEEAARYDIPLSAAARHAGVSRSTIWRVQTGGQSLRSDTAERLIRAIRDLSGTMPAPGGAETAP
jgi:predicted transcriptional regulator